MGSSSRIFADDSLARNLDLEPDMGKLLLLCCVLGASACATAAPGAGPDAANAVSAADRNAVIAAVQSLFDAMRARDTTALRAAFVPGAQLVSITPVTGAEPRVRTQPLAGFVTSIGAEPQELVERMWDPRVEIAGDLASLWAPYDFRIGTTFNHCGHDAVHLVRTPQGWKIAGITYTAIRTGCATR